MKQKIYPGIKLKANKFFLKNTKLCIDAAHPSLLADLNGNRPDPGQQ